MITQGQSQSIINSTDWKDLISRIKRAELFVSDWHKNIQRWRKLYNNDHYQRAGTTSEVLYNDPTYTNTVDLSVGIMLGNDLRWHAYGFSPSAAEQIATGKMEKLIAGILAINNEREEEHLLFQLFQNFNRDGGGALYSVFDPDLASAYQETIDVPDGTMGVKQAYKFSEVPLRVKVVDPLQIICLPGGPKKWLLIGRVEERSALDVEAQYGIKIERFATMSQEEKASRKEKFYDIWDYVWVSDNPAEGNFEVTKTMPEPGVRKLAVRNTRIFGDQPVFGPQVMDGYTDLPYTVQFYKPVGKDSGDFHSILTPLESSVGMLERAFNRRAKQIDIFTALPLIAKTQISRKVVIDPGLYNSITLTPDESIEFPKWPGNSPDVQQHMDMLRSRIQQSGFSDVMFGSGQNQIAGYALSQLGDQNRIRLQQPIQHLELLLTTWAKKALRLLEQFAPGTILCVYGHQKGQDYMDEVSMDELKGFSVRAEIRPNFPNEEMRRVAMSTQVKGAISDYTRMEKYLNIEQPEDEQKRQLIEAAQRNPIAMQFALMAELMEIAEGPDKKAAKIAVLTLQSLQNGMQGQAGRPKEPNAPEQPTGLASPTGQEPVPGEAAPGDSTLETQQNLANQAPQLKGGM